MSCTLSVFLIFFSGRISNQELDLQVELLKEIAALEHRDLDCILLGCDHSVDEACTLGKDLSVIKKMENIYKQAKVSEKLQNAHAETTHDFAVTDSRGFCFVSGDGSANYRC